MFYNFQNRLILHGELKATTALRIGAGRSLESTSVGLPVVKDSLGKPFIPGSSFKGVLRSRIESLLRTLAPANLIERWACNPLNDQERCIRPNQQHLDKKKKWRDYTLADPVGIDDLQEEATKREEYAKKRAEEQHLSNYRKQDDFLAELVQEHTCLACQLFGSPWLASRVQVRDWLVDERYWFDQFLVRDGVAIDRDTETTGDQLLYTYEVIPAGTRFSGCLVVENADPWQLGLLFTGLREFAHGLALGGAASRGLGSIHLTWDAQSRYVDRTQLWAYLENAETAGESYQDKEVAWKTAMLTELRKRCNGKGVADAQAIN